MRKQSEDQILDTFTKAFHQVVEPILKDHEKILKDHGKMLEDHGKQLTVLTKGIKAIRESVDSHTASLMELEKMPQLLGEIYNEVKGFRVKIRNHEERISKVEDHLRL